MSALNQRMDGGRVFDGHWSQHYTFDKADLTKALVQVGGLDHRRADDVATKFVIPDLIHLSKIANEQVFPENTYAEAFALAPDSPPWYMESYTYYDVSYTGSPEDASGLDWSDPGRRADVNRKPNLSPILPKTTMYGFNVAELARMAALGQSLPALGAMQARRIIETEFDVRAWLGRPSLGIPGLISTTGIATDSAGTQWDSATTEAIYSDIRLKLYQQIINNSLGVWRPTHLALPQTVETIFTRPMVLGGTSLMVTLGEYVKKNLNLELIFTVRLNSAKIGSDVSNTGVAVMYRKDALTQRHVLCRGYYENAAQMVGRDLQILCDGVSGGLVVPQPTSVAALSNVAAAL